MLRLIETQIKIAGMVQDTQKAIFVTSAIKGILDCVKMAFVGNALVFGTLHGTSEVLGIVRLSIRGF